jgi:hypothetical protein
MASQTAIWKRRLKTVCALQRLSCLTFTDGISKAMNAAQLEWGEERMIAEAKAHADLNAAELL